SPIRASRRGDPAACPPAGSASTGPSGGRISRDRWGRRSSATCWRRAGCCMAPRTAPYASPRREPPGSPRSASCRGASFPDGNLKMQSDVSPAAELRRIYERWHETARAGDVEGLAALYAEDALFESPLVMAILDGRADGVLRGKKELRHF